MSKTILTKRPYLFIGVAMGMILWTFGILEGTLENTNLTVRNENIEAINHYSHAE